MHVDFAYSKNLQVKTANIEATAATRERVRQYRQLQTGMEVVICAPSHLVVETIYERVAGGEVNAGASGRVYSRRAYVRPPHGGIATAKSRVFRFDPDPMCLTSFLTPASEDIQRSAPSGTACSSIWWSPRQELNLRPAVYKTAALPTELLGRCLSVKLFGKISAVLLSLSPINRSDLAS